MTRMPGRDIVLSIDVGTTSMRAAWFDLSGGQASSVISSPTNVDSDANGRSTIEPDAFLADVVSLIDRAILILPPGGRAAGVGLSTFWHSLLGLACDQKPATPLFTWADRRARDAASELANAPDAQQLHNLTGAPAHSSYWPAKLRWLASQQPQWFTNIRHWVSGADYLYLNLFGRLDTSISMASGTGLFDLTALDWNGLAISSAGISEAQLPPISDEPHMGLTKQFRMRWPALDAVPWFKGIGDGACSNIGAGCEDSETLVLMLGTSGSMRVVSRAVDWPPLTPGRWCYRVDSNTFASGMALSEGGAVAEWASSFLAIDRERIEKQVMAMEADGHGLTVLPYILGMRSPLWREGETATVAGISFATRPEELYRAFLESVGLRFLSLLDLLEAARPAFKRLVATGGGFRQSAAWAQIICDCLGRDLTISDVPEASLRGAAIHAIRGLGLSINESEWPERHLKPHMGNHASYRNALDRQLRLLTALTDFR